MDKVLVTGLLIIAAVIAVSVMIGSIGTTIGRSGQAVKESQLSAAKKIETSITIIEAIPQFGPFPPPPAAPQCPGVGLPCTVDVWVKNVGQADIRPLSGIDVFVLSSTGHWGEYMTFDAGCSPSGASNSWSPLPCGQDNWIPNQTLHIRISVWSSPLSPGHYSLDVTTPNGIQDKFLFEVVT